MILLMHHSNVTGGRRAQSVSEDPPFTNTLPRPRRVAGLPPLVLVRHPPGPEGNSGIIYPGLAQRMSAGSGILHSERNDSPADPVHLVQMWVVPDETGQEPGYEQLEIEPGELEN